MLVGAGGAPRKLFSGAGGDVTRPY